MYMLSGLVRQMLCQGLDHFLVSNLKTILVKTIGSIPFVH